RPARSHHTARDLGRARPRGSPPPAWRWASTRHRSRRQKGHRVGGCALSPRPLRIVRSCSDRGAPPMTNTKRLGLTELVLRDAHQSLLATRLRLDDMLPIAEQLDQVGYWSMESWGGATFDACIRYLG